MIRRTFLILPAVGAAREKALWRDGIGDWTEFRSRPSAPGISSSRKEDCDRVIAEAEIGLDDRDSRLLASMLPRQESWRLYDDFKEEAAFLDIETDGLSPGCSVTMVGVHGPAGTEVMVSGEGLDACSIAEALEGASMLVTFNGSCFDLPVLAAEYPSLDLGLPHLDLRFAARRAGLRGGLKAVEGSLGLRRDEGIADVDGREAVRLWNRWRRGCRGSLDTLMEYNRADTENLSPVADTVCSLLERMTTGDGHEV